MRATAWPNLAPRYRLPLLILGLLALVSGVSGGLLRLGLDLNIAVPLPADPGNLSTQFVAQVMANHGALMVAAFFGTIISLERAVALTTMPWYLAPLCAGLGGLALINGAEVPASLSAGLFTLAALIFLIGSVRIWQKQRALFTLTLALGALNWLLGNLFWFAGNIASAVVLWMNFLLLTIAGERLELTRLRPPQPGAVRGFIVILILIHAAAWLVALTGESRAYAGSMLLLALWLLRFDIAWTTVRGDGLPRFVAVCLLTGYAQLTLGALLGLDGALSTGHPWRDAALHAEFLGFVFSMVIGHAPIIFPAVMRVRIPYHPVFYLPLAVLHGSVLARVIATGAGEPVWRQWASVGNALALVLLIATLLGRIVVGRVSSRP